jgi:Domain of unknown function (DUF4190)
VIEPEHEPPQRGNEYPPPTNLPPAVNPTADPDAPLEYPASHPGPPGYPPGFADLPPPVYPPPYPGPVGYPPPYPGQVAQPYPYRPAAPAGTNGKAIGALVTALLGIPACMCFVPSLVGIVLGVIAMGETKRTGQSGYGFALAGVVVGIATLLLGGFVTAFGLVSN